MTDDPGRPCRSALVTGASSGIGEATARLLASRGVTVGLVARRAERLANVLDACREGAPESRTWTADLSDPAAAARVARESWDALGGFDVLVNNAGIPMRRHASRLSLDDVERVMRVNYLSPVSMSLAILPLMIERGSGVIVNVSSLGGRLGIAGESAYSASKFALCGFSESLLADLDGTGVAVRLVLPGAIDTEIWDQPGNEPAFYDGPLTQAADVAAAIAASIAGEAFECYVPDMKAVVEAKTSDVDTFVSAMLSVARAKRGRVGPT